MSETAAANPNSASEGRAYVEVWAESMAQVLTQIAAARCGVECPEPAPPDAPPPAESDVHVSVVSAGALRGEMNLRLPRTAALAMGQLLLGETRDPGAEFKPEHGEAAEELLRQVAGHAATALKPRWGEVQVSVARGTPPSWPAAATGWMCSSPGAAFLFCLEWQLSAALVAGLRPAPVPAGPPAAGMSVSPEGKLDLLMDVELDLTLRFGGRRMLLREILELSAGSVVELDRQVQEPADLLLDGRLIARGEVVVVDGSYGLRVTELVAPQLPG